MAVTANHFNMSAMLILVLLITVSLDFTVAQTGVAYGRNGNVPPPQRTVELYKQYGIQRMRIYEPDLPTLEALRGSNIELTVSILNRFLADIAASPPSADAWLQNNVKNYPDVMFRNIVVGNEIGPASENAQYVLGAMQNVQNAISAAGLGGQIKVTTSLATDLLAKSFPPEEGEFKPEVTEYLRPIIQFLVSSGSPLFASIYPYFSYLETPGMDLAYALLDPNYPGVTTQYGHTYKNLFYALVDAVYAAIDKIVGSSPELSDADISTMEVGGGESGWPTEGGPPKIGGPPKLTGVDDVPSSLENAKAYVNNLIQLVKSGSGTPLRPDRPVRTFIFAMFDENQKLGREDERHFGIFTAEGQPKYEIPSQF